MINNAEIRNKQLNLEQNERRVAASKKALAGLAWFGTYAIDPSTKEVMPNTLVGDPSLGSPGVPRLIVATSTQYAEAAGHYVERAFKELRQVIVCRAIEMAQEELAENEGEKP